MTEADPDADDAVTLAQRLTAVGYLAGWRSVAAVPEPVAAKAFQLAADLAYDRRGPGTVRLARNLRRVLGGRATPSTLAATVRAGLRSYARYWLETFRLERMDHDAVVATALADSPGYEQTVTAREAGRGVILALPHSGNWEIAGLCMVHVHGGITTVAERLRPDSLYRRFVAYREGLGFEMLPLTGGDRPASTVLRERLTQGRMICLLGDRDFTSKGIPVTFFGQPTTMPSGPAMLAALTGAALFPVHLSYPAPGRWRQYVGPEITLPGERLAQQVRGGTQALAAVFEEQIGRYPADWHMLQPFWPADADPSTGAAT